MRKALPGDLTKASGQSSIGAVGTFTSFNSLKVRVAMWRTALSHPRGFDKGPTQPAVAARKQLPGVNFAARGIGSGEQPCVGT